VSIGFDYEKLMIYAANTTWIVIFFTNVVPLTIKEDCMKKLIISTLVLSTLGFGMAAHAGQSTITAGYAQSKVQGLQEYQWRER
jgi:hypothetical protein